MNLGTIYPGDEKADPSLCHYCWDCDMANNLHNNTLWLWAAKSAHLFMEWRGGGLMVLVLYQIFAMGLYD